MEVLTTDEFMKVLDNREILDADPEMKKLMYKYRLPRSTTPELLEQQIRTFFPRSVMIHYGEHIIIAGYYPNESSAYRRDNPYYSATYEYKDINKHNIEDKIHLTFISQTKFSDSGHALLWQMHRLNDHL